MLSTKGIGSDVMTVLLSGFKVSITARIHLIFVTEIPSGITDFLKNYTEGFPTAIASRISTGIA